MTKLLKKVNLFALVSMLTLGLILSAFSPVKKVVPVKKVEPSEKAAFQETRGILEDYSSTHWRVTPSAVSTSSCNGTASFPCTGTVNTAAVTEPEAGVFIVPKSQVTNTDGVGPFIP
ncbi:hypothetical protein [Parapedobacter koreensis]|uniref:Uncharacterized protein n=1 Tax=Parapedobacter koreensis TaxID=332977 RepID=A0A1H7FD96_9SPHI|nr:hypothetical protein [Parapedobacter koreensis]SEK24071.1 hypothetical protein SAMN05421740_101314 [Parapedobacter koreensis]